MAARFVIVPALFALLHGEAALADLYSFEDERGIHLSNVPSDPRYALKLREAPEGPAVQEPTGGEGSRESPFAGFIEKAARERGLSAHLVSAVIATESAYNPRAVSSKGAIGLMQLMPEVARRYGVADCYDPEANITAGTRYLHDLLVRFGNNLPLALAAYNAGADAVEQHGNRIPPYRETQAYVASVMDRYAKLRTRGK